MLRSDCSSSAAASRCVLGSPSPFRRPPNPVARKAAIDAGFHAVTAGVAVTFGSPRWIRHILPDHELRGAGGRGSGLYTARYGCRHCLSVRFRADLLISALSTAVAAT